MTGTSLLALLDDIASILDDVSVLTKIAAKKTAGVLGDDLALNAEQVSGVTPDRELPVVWAVAKGSAINKLILVPVALAFSVIAPWAVTWLLMVGGAFLCFEGFEKLAHKFTRDLRPVDSSGLRPLRGLPPEEFTPTGPERVTSGDGPSKKASTSFERRGAKSGKAMRRYPT